MANITGIGGVFFKSKGLYRDVLARVSSPPADQPYGLREFSVEDPNGIDIIFGQDIEP